MRAAAFETVLPNEPINALPLNIVQTTSRTSPLLMLALALPAAIVALTPFSMIALHASQDASMLIERQETSLLLGLALILWAAVFAWPIARRAGRMGAQRKISIEDHKVVVVDSGLFGEKTWAQPLSAYLGLAHHVRSSLSGTRHELLLIHPDPNRSLMVRTADKISQNEIDGAAEVLGCREIAPQVFYRNIARADRGAISAGKPALVAAE